MFSAIEARGRMNEPNTTPLEWLCAHTISPRARGEPSPEVYDGSEVRQEEIQNPSRPKIRERAGRTARLPLITELRSFSCVSALIPEVMAKYPDHRLLHMNYAPISANMYITWWSSINLGIAHSFSFAPICTIFSRNNTILFYYFQQL